MATEHSYRGAMLVLTKTSSIIGSKLHIATKSTTRVLCAVAGTLNNAIVLAISLTETGWQRKDYSYQSYIVKG